jgi:hypothetical protein
MASHDHFVKLYGGLLLLVKLSGTLLLGEVVHYTSPLGGYTTAGQDFLRHFSIVFTSSPAYHPLPQITMSGVEILDRLVHFSIVV